MLLERRLYVNPTFEGGALTKIIDEADLQSFQTIQVYVLAAITSFGEAIGNRWRPCYFG